VQSCHATGDCNCLTAPVAGRRSRQAASTRAHRHCAILDLRLRLGRPRYLELVAKLGQLPVQLADLIVVPAAGGSSASAQPRTPRETSAMPRCQARLCIPQAHACTRARSKAASSAPFCPCRNARGGLLERGRRGLGCFGAKDALHRVRCRRARAAGYALHGGRCWRAGCSRGASRSLQQHESAAAVPLAIGRRGEPAPPLGPLMRSSWCTAAAGGWAGANEPCSAYSGTRHCSAPHGAR